MSEAEVTRDPARIKAWAEARGGRPSVVLDTKNNSKPGAMLRFDFGKKDESLDEVSWDEFFRILDANSLAVLLQEKTKSGNTSRFCKFVDAQEHGLSTKPPAKAASAAGGRGAAKKASTGKASTARKGGETAKAQPAGAAKSKPAASKKATAAKAARDEPKKGNGKASSPPDPTEATVTRDHGRIRDWAEARGGRPCIVEGTEGGESGGLLRLDFGKPDPKLREVSWDDFFDVFEKSGVGFLHQEKTKSGRPSRFNKFVDADAQSSSASPSRAGAPAKTAAATSTKSDKSTSKSGGTAAKPKTAKPKKAPTKSAGSGADTLKKSAAPSKRTEASPKKGAAAGAAKAAGRSGGASSAKTEGKAEAEGKRSRTAKKSSAAPAKTAPAKTAAASAGSAAADEAVPVVDHDRIRQWVEERGGRPCHVAETAARKGELGILRIDFGKPEERLEEVTWPKFFKAFEKNKLAFLCKDRTKSGRISRFHKFIERG